MALGVPKYWKTFRAWLKTPLGQSLIKEESRKLSSILPKLFGYHLLLLGEAEFATGLKPNPITHRVWAHPFISQTTTLSPLGSRLDKLPILSDEIDLVYLPHCLESLKNPHEVLRESYRVLRPEGHLIITSFNPFSIWSLIRIFVRFFKRAPWDGHFITPNRLKDWLALLGFDVLDLRKCFYRPPLQHEKLMQKLKWLERFGSMIFPFFGASYIILARKRVLTLTAIRPKFLERKRVLAPGFVEPARLDKQSD